MKVKHEKLIGTKEKKKSRNSAKRYIPLYIIFGVVALYVAVFSYVPMVGNIIAFKKFNFSDGIFGSPWVGLEFFKRFLLDRKFWQVVKNTLVISFTNILFAFPAPIILAILMNEVKHTRFKKVVQTLTYLPHFVSFVIVYGFLYNFFSANGFVNSLRSLFGLDTISFLGSTKWYIPLYIGSDIWQGVGWGTIVYLAALTGVDTTLYEAADIDGARRWHKIRYISIPAITPMISISLIMSFSSVLNVGLEKTMLMINSMNEDIAETLSYYVYRVGLVLYSSTSFSYSAAIGTFKAVISVMLVLICNMIVKKIDEEGALW